jgi:hypothetical protein
LQTLKRLPFRLGSVYTGKQLLTQSGFTHLVKMDAPGGRRNTEAELWVHRGGSCTNGGGCYIGLTAAKSFAHSVTPRRDMQLIIDGDTFHWGPEHK